MKSNLIAVHAALAVIGSPFVAHANPSTQDDGQVQATQANEASGKHAERALPDAFEPSRNAY